MSSHPSNNLAVASGWEQHALDTNRYSGLVVDCEGDATLLWELKKAKDNLEHYFHSHYCAPPSRPSTPPLTSSPAALLSAFDSPEKVDFTARYETLPIESVDEWEEFL